jgi:hypothetical protein
VLVQEVLQVLMLEVLIVLGLMVPAALVE